MLPSVSPPCSILEAGVTQDYSLSSCWPLGFGFISLSSHSPLSSFPPVSPSSHLRPPHCASVRSCLNSALLSTLLPPSACSCCPRRLFDKTFRSSNEHKPAARQQWSPCVHLITASLLWPGRKPPRMLVRLVNGASDMTLYIRTHHQNRAKHVRLSWILCTSWLPAGQTSSKTGSDLSATAPPTCFDMTAFNDMNRVDIALTHQQVTLLKTY